MSGKAAATVVPSATATVTEGTTADAWERMWAPYDEATYSQVLQWLNPADIVLDIGAGDMRLAGRMAAKAGHVVAIELNRDLESQAAQHLPTGNLSVIWGDAYQIPFPTGITVAVLLMRHCQGFPALLNKLHTVGCRRLITNARWRTGVELIDLQRSPTRYPVATLGWYACRCGATGFVQGPPERLTAQIEAALQEVIDCPACGLHNQPGHLSSRSNGTISGK